MARYLLCLALLSACAEAPFEYQVDCFRYSSEVELDVAALQYNTALAKKVIEEGDIGVKTFCTDYGQVGVWVESGRRLIDAEHAGKYQAGGPTPLVVSSNTEALVHELLHGWDFTHLAWDTANHTAWERWGYYEIIKAYLSCFKDPTVNK